MGGDPADVIFSGVGKSVAEIDLALKVGIGCFNVESRSELLRIEDRAQLAQVRAPISIRVNPNVDAKTHPYISTGLKSNKFGVVRRAHLRYTILRQTVAHFWLLELIAISVHKLLMMDHCWKPSTAFLSWWTPWKLATSA